MSRKYQPAGVGMAPSKTELGSFIRVRRLELDIRQNTLAEQTGLSRNLVSMLEVGTRRYLNDQQLQRLAGALQYNPEELRKRMPVKYIAQPTTELGKFVYSRRKELGLTLTDLAKKMEITPEQAKRLEIRDNPSIRYGLVKPLANALDLDLFVLARFMGITRIQTKSKLGQLVRTRRKELGMSSRQLAEILRVSYQYVNQIELGKCRLSENDDMIKQLAEVLELDVNKLGAVRPPRKLKQIDTTNPLGGFLAVKRLELHLTQQQIGNIAGITASVVSNVEIGKIHPSPKLLHKLSRALNNCQIPPELLSH